MLPKLRPLNLVLLNLLAAATLAAPAPQGNPVDGWLSWRGPQQNGTSNETGLFSELELDGKNHLWSYDIRGRGTPVVAGDRVYAFAYGGEGKDLQERLICLDANTGELIWEDRWNDFLSDSIYDRYAIGSPTIDPSSGQVYVMSTAGLVRAYTADGELLWERSTMSELGRLTFPNGRTGSLVIEDKLAIMHSVTSSWGPQGPARSRMYAFDKDTGEIVWSSTPGGPPKDVSFSMPVVEWRNGRRVIYAGYAGGHLAAVDARTGDVLWRFQMSIGGMSSSVLLYKDSLIAIHGKENLDSSAIGRMIALPLGAEPGPEDEGPVALGIEDELWRADLMAFTSSPVLVGNRVYQTTATGELVCVDAATGEILWRKNLAPDQIHASPAYADGKLYVPMNNGSFFVVRPGEEGPEVLSEVQLEGNCLGAPAIAAGRVYVHTTEKLYCFGSAEGAFPAKPMEHPIAKPGPAVRLQVIPADVLLRPGDEVRLRVHQLDSAGATVAVATPDASFKSPLAGLTVADGMIKVAADASLGAGVLAVSSGDLVGSSRVRIAPNLPLAEDFDSIALGEEDGAIADPPSYWIGAKLKWDVLSRDGNQVLAKNLDRPLFQRCMSFFGHPDMSNYTIQADILTDGNRRSRSSAGIINQRYLIQLKGNHQQLEISSNEMRIKESVPFTWNLDAWYTLKSRVDLNEDGSGVVRAKAWPAGEEEPEEWNIEVEHAAAHRTGSPGVFGFAPQSRFRVYMDNLIVTPNE